jgi:hypothetical protein
VLEACWTALLLGRDPGEPERRVLALSRTKVGPRAASLRWVLEPRGAVTAAVWQGPCAWNADEAVMAVTDQQAEGLSRVEECAQYMRALLRPGPMPARDLAALCAHAGFGEITMRRARKFLGVRAVRTSLSTWETALPEAAPG